MSYQNILTIEEICRKLKPLFGEKIDELYLRYSITENRDEREEIHRILSALYNKNLSELLNRKVLLEPPRKEEVLGNYPLGTVTYADKELFDFCLREEDWPRHLCISGMSGSGKTNLAFQVIQNLIDRDKPFLIFDWKKSFRPLMLADDRIMCFTVGNDAVTNKFMININKPPRGITPKEWISTLCDLLTESFQTSFGVHKVLLETLDKAFTDFKIYDGSENYPTWETIKQYLEIKAEKTNGREAGWIESAMRIATVLTFGALGKIVNNQGEEGASIENFLDKKIIFELNTLGSVEKKFFCEFILTYIYKYKKVMQNTTDRDFDHAIIVDEAHNIFLKDKTFFVKESVTDVIYREMREYGTSLICLDQHISKISDTVKGNSACHIAFQQQLPQDIYDISELMQLREQKQIFSQLQVGSAIVKLSERYHLPFLIQVPLSELRKETITDQEVIERLYSSVLDKKYVSEEPVENIKEKEIIETKIKTETKINNEYNKINENQTPDNLAKNPPQISVNKNIISNIPKPSLQELLHQFIEKKLSQGMNLKQIEQILEDNKDRGNYSGTEIMQAINWALEKQLAKRIDVQEAFKPKTINFKNSENLTKEEEMFINFLLENPDHEESTVGIYKTIGLSPRKGNQIKNELLEKNIITIQEQKNQKGWKKIIRLTSQ